MRVPICPLFPYTTLFRSIQQGQAASLTQCVAASLRYATLLLFTYALLGSAVYIGLIALVLPGIWLYARLSQGPFIVMLEQQNRSEEHTSELQSRGHLVCR